MSEIKCPVCGGSMWDNRTTKTNPKAPDYRCKDDNCKFQWSRETKTYVPGEYVTAAWEQKGQTPQANNGSTELLQKILAELVLINLALKFNATGDPQKPKDTSNDAPITRSKPKSTVGEKVQKLADAEPEINVEDIPF